MLKTTINITICLPELNVLSFTILMENPLLISHTVLNNTCVFTDSNEVT